MWVVLSIVTPMYFFTMFYRLAPSVLAGDISVSLNLDLAELAGVSGITWVSYGLMQLPSGLFVDIFGGRRCLFWICLLACAGNLCFAFSQGAELALVARFILGLGCAVICPCCAVIATSLPAAQYGRANSLFLAFGLGGSILAGAPLVFCSGLFGWRMVLVGCAGISLLSALAAWFLLPEQRGGAAATGDRLRQLLQNLALMWRNACEVLRVRAIWPYCMWMMLMVGAYFTITALWWAPYLCEVCGLSPAQAGDVISLVCLIMLPVQPLVISVSDRCGSRVWVVRVCTVISLLAAVILTLWGQALGWGAIIAAWCGFLLATAYVSSVMYTSIREMFPNRLIGTATGCLQTFPYVFGVPLMQSAFGGLVQWREAAGTIASTAYAEAMWLIVGIIAAGLVAAFLMREPRALAPEEDALPISPHDGDHPAPSEE